jgi:RimJ/RimL family protein N-acetyltransferase
MLTGPNFCEDHTLGDGTRVVLRHVRPEDAEELRRGFDKLSPSSRYRRFLGGVHALSDETLRYLTCVDGHDHVAIVAVQRAPDGTETGLGIARFVRTAGDASVAEAAITVVDDVQGRGLGRILGLALARAGLERGVTRFRGEILANNQPVRQLLEDVGAVLQRADDKSLVFDIELGPDAKSTPSGVGGFDAVARTLLRAASSHLVGLIRGLGPPPPAR